MNNVHSREGVTLGLLFFEAIVGALLGALVGSLAVLPLPVPPLLGAVGGTLCALTLVLGIRTFTAPARSPLCREAFQALKRGALVSGLCGMGLGTVLGVLVEIALRPPIPFFFYTIAGGALGAAAYSFLWAIIHLFASPPGPTPPGRADL